MKKIILAIVIVCQLFMVGCIQKKNVEDKEENTLLTYGMEEFPKTLVLKEDSKERSEDLICSLFDGLVTIGSNKEIIGSLAESYEVTNDGIGYTFKLREDIKWSNGKPIVASDFVEFFKNILDPSLKNPYASELYSIYGAKEFNEGKKTFKDVAINSTDNKTLNIRMNNANEEFLKILSKPNYRLRKNFNKLYNYTSSYKEIEYSGPYVIEDLKENEFILLKRNEGYWDKVEENQVKLVRNSPEKSLASFNSGKTDIIFNIPLKETSIDTSMGNLEFYPTGDMFALLFNHSKKDLGGNLSFRKAINESVKLLYNEEDLYSKAGLIQGKGDMAFKNYNEDVMQTSGGYKGDVDISKIKSIFKDMDYDEKTVINMVFLNDNKNKLIAEKLEEILKDQLELSINKKFLNQEEFNKTLEDGEYDLALKFYKQPVKKEDFFKLWTKDNKRNISRYNNGEYDKILNKVLVDKEKDFITPISILSRDITYIPVYYDSLSYAISKEVSGVELDGNNNILLKKVNKNNK
ncbi:ABC transporter substrate-binding protein [Clostridium hydrogeniformans]|uniref:ABC transporter substrate-binding protein n=1 Tax=Clostridium hydrogeniformans TaxID=349933 RepID=UPI000487CDB6|nr:ABC transporter substrate-binding protein [Clostridium hydrogeniformans]